MRSAKEYNTTFRLAAEMDAKFNGVFSAAQKKLAETRQKIQELSKEQSQISAYTKQQESIKKTSEKLEHYQKRLELVRQAMAQNKDKSAEYQLQEFDLKKKIEDTEAALVLKTMQLDKMGKALRDAGVDTSNLASRSNELQAQIIKLREEETEAANQIKEMGDKGQGAFSAIGDALAAAGIVQGLHMAYDGFKDCVYIASEFEAKMSEVEALSGATADEMAQLSAQAKQLGATTKFTAYESASAMSYMAMAGWDAVEMMNGMDGVLQLAAASGEDLAMVSDIVTDNLTAFGLAASDTAHFSDVLAAAATNSNTSVSIMGETFKHSASIAGALGYSIEDVAVAVGLMANAGVKGTIAGTALKNTFNGLLSGATLTARAFGEVEFTAINADGTMKSFAQTINELRGYFEQMTKAEKVNNAMTIAGQRGYNGLLAILNSTDAEYNSLTETISNCSGSAKKMAEIKLDNLKGQVTLMNSAMDALKTTIGEEFNPELRALAETATNVLAGVNEFAQKYPAIVKAIMAITAEVGALAVAVTAASALKKLIDLTAIANPAFLGVSAAVATLTFAITALTQVEKDTKNSLTPIYQEQQERIEALNAEYDETCKKYGETSEEALRLKYQINDLTAEFESNKQTLAEYVAECDELIRSSSEVIQSYQNGAEELKNNELNALALVRQLSDLSSQSIKTAATEEQMIAIINRLNKMFPELSWKTEDAAGHVEDFAESMRKAAEKEYKEKKQELQIETYINTEAAQKELEKKINETTALLEKEREKHNFTFDIDQGKYINGWLDWEDSWWAKLTTGIDEYKAELAGLQAQYDENEAQMAAMDNEWEGLREAAEQAANSTEKNTSAYNALNAAFTEVGASVETLIASYNDAYQAAYDSIYGQYKLWDNAAEVIATDVEAVNESLETQWAYWQDYNDDLAVLAARAEDIEGLSSLLSTFADGSPESVNMVKGMVNATDEQLSRMVELWSDVSESQSKTAESLADLKVDFDNGLIEIEESIQSSVENMNLADQAAIAAERTIEAYINTLKSYKGEVGEAADMVADAVADSLNSIDVNKKYSPVIPEAKIVLPTDNLNAYAEGTDSATRGIAIVGEYGPELVRFTGGEQVYTSEETRRIFNAVNDIDLINRANKMERFFNVVSEVDAFNSVTDYNNARLLDKYNGISRVMDVENNINPAFARALDYEETMRNKLEYLQKIETFSNPDYFNSVNSVNEFYTPEIEKVLNYYDSLSASLPELDNNPVYPEPLMAIPRAKPTVNITVSPTFVIQGGSSDNVMNEFKAPIDEIVKRVADLLDERNIDAERSAYI